MRKNKPILVWIFLVVILGVVVFFAWKLISPNQRNVAAWKNADVRCLSNREPVSGGDYSVLQILVDGSPEAIPEQIGVAKRCMAELYTSDISGTIYIDPATPEKTFTLGQFFKIWREPMEREGYKMHMTVNGLPNTQFENLVLEDKQLIILEYDRK
ncbi:MAG: hypothetical protein AAB407_02600 [Patescibacteria group bacterium]